MAESLEVALSGIWTGTLTRSRDGRVGFEYDAQYLQRRSATPLSVSIPITRASHDADVVMPWIDNLLPDNDDVRQRWAADFGERQPTAFNLLRHMGADCAGAIQVVPSRESLTTQGSRTPISEAEIAERLRLLRADESAWSFADTGGRWSLGGQQGKFALSHGTDGQWYLPEGREPSTHIVKVGIAGLQDSAAAEFVSMRAARALGLTVAPTEIATFEGEPAVVVTRFDRLIIGAEVRRIHQEDMCQASGLWRASKYQADAGPSVADISGLMSRALDRRDLDASRVLFAQAAAFNWLTAGTDAHAKNFALLLVGPRTALAPLYDLMSSALVLPEKEVLHRGKLAMKFGGEYRLRGIARRHVTAAAVDLAVEPDWFFAMARDLAARIPDAVSDAVEGAKAVLNAAARARFVDVIARRVGAITSDVLNSAAEPRALSDGARRTRPGRG